MEICECIRIDLMDLSASPWFSLQTLMIELGVRVMCLLTIHLCRLSYPPLEWGVHRCAFRDEVGVRGVAGDGDTAAGAGVELEVGVGVGLELEVEVSVQSQ